eukprot:11218030-Lingulodinium_polyedra.AAC.1
MRPRRRGWRWLHGASPRAAEGQPQWPGAVAGSIQHARCQSAVPTGTAFSPAPRARPQGQAEGPREWRRPGRT